jgi:hypothetical protein
MSTAHATFSRIAIFFVVLTLGVAQADPGPKTVGPLGGGASDVEIAFAHAPVHYQDTDNNFPWADYITKFDFDVNWRADDNWDNLMKHPLLARGYFSVVETCTHWFVVYGFFHPRDWTEIPVWWDTEHENDMEGVLAVVRKPGPSGPRLGQLEAIVTVAHTDFYSYVPKGSSFKNGAETIDGELNFIDYAGSRRPKTSQEPKGHGLKAWPFTGDFDGLDARDGIIYYPSRHDSDVPCSGDDRYVKYRLEDFFSTDGMWARQLEEADLDPARALTFFQWGTFKGNSSGGCGIFGGLYCNPNAANSPWMWDDKNDGPVHAGEMALDPAHLVSRYFSNLGSFGTKYLRSKYVSDLKDEQYGGTNLPRGWPRNLDLDGLYAKMVTSCD